MSVTTPLRETGSSPGAANADNAANAIAMEILQFITLDILSKNALLLFKKKDHALLRFDGSRSLGSAVFPGRKYLPIPRRHIKFV